MAVNVEAAACAVLRKAGFAAFSDVPDGERAARPAEFCVVERVGGSRRGFTDAASLTIDCHAPTRYEASEMAYAVDAAMAALESEPGVMRVRSQSMANYSDVLEGTAGLYRLGYEVVALK